MCRFAGGGADIFLDGHLVIAAAAVLNAVERAAGHSLQHPPEYHVLRPRFAFKGSKRLKRLIDFYLRAMAFSTRPNTTCCSRISRERIRAASKGLKDFCLESQE